jgi:hypothetical protein
MIMKLMFTILALTLAVGTPAMAQTGPADKPDSQSLSSDKTPPANTGGTTAAPTAEPKSGTLSDTAKEPTEGGSNAQTNPTGKPSTSDLGSKKTNN